MPSLERSSASKRVSLVLFVLFSCVVPGDCVAKGLTRSHAMEYASESADRSVNVVGEFLTCWDALPQSPAGRVQMFETCFIERHQELFTENVVSLLKATDTPQQRQQKIASYLDRVAGFVPTIRILNARLGTDLRVYQTDFKKTFPDFVQSLPVIFTISMGSFDGATRDVGGRSALLFGVDVIAKLYGPGANLSVLFDHELFHVYQRQVSPELSNGPLWMSLWDEGLAVYVSWRMNASATVSDVLLNKQLVAQASPKVSCLAAGLLKNSRSMDSDVYAKYFLGGEGAGDPARSGYFVGFLIVSELGKDRSLQELSRMSGDGLRTDIERVLAALGNQSGQQTSC